MAAVFTTGDTTIMTRFATGDFAVIHIDTGPAARRRNMTGAAIVSRGGMITRFTRRRGIIVTGHTGTDDFIVIHVLCRHRYPRRWSRLVTGSAVVGGVDVATTFASGCVAIMATDTGTKDLRMINGR